MIYQIEIENFFSIKDRQVIDLRVSGKVPDDFARFAPIFPGASTRAPKIVALYGANASGKTNVLQVLAFLAHFVRSQGYPNGIATKNDPSIAPFNDKESQTRLTRFAVEFAAIMDATAELAERASRGESVPYGTCRYELELMLANGVIKAVSRESLRQRPNDQGKWQRIFERDSTGSVEVSPRFSIIGFRHLLNTLDPRGSIIANFAQFNHPGAKYWRERANDLSYPPNLPASIAERNLIDSIHIDEILRQNLNDDLSRVDVGIDEIQSAMTGHGAMLKFKHHAMENELSWDEESHGTRAFIRLYPLLVKTLESSGVAVIDELDAALHPLMVAEILDWFRNPERNPHNAQLWFSGHAATLMDDLSMEEIIFCEKDRQGRTTLFGARDIARRSDNLRRKYLSGIYGAVPQIG